MSTIATLAPIPVVLRVACRGCGARAGVWCDGGKSICAQRMDSSQDEFEAQRRATRRDVVLDEWSDDEPTVPMRGVAWLRDARGQR